MFGSNPEKLKSKLRSQIEDLKSSETGFGQHSLAVHQMKTALCLGRCRSTLKKMQRIPELNSDATDVIDLINSMINDGTSGMLGSRVFSACWNLTRQPGD
jgi:hypothetical protein